MDIYDYSSEQREFSKVPKFKDIKFEYQSNTLIGNIIKPLVIATCYKGIPQPSIYAINADKDYVERGRYLIKKLENKFPDVPVIRCKRFMNACYIVGLDDILSNPYFTKSTIEDYCDEYGMDYNEFMRKASRDAILFGDFFANPATLAHEFGHYMNTRMTTDKVGNNSHKMLPIIRFSYNILSQLDKLAVPVGAFLRQQDKYKTFIGLAANHVLKSFSQIPLILAEYKASEYGLKLLKEVGATEQEVNEARSDLRYALHSYGSHRITIPLIKAGLSAVGAAAVHLLI